MPKAGFELVARYQFQKTPNQQEMLGDTLIFQQGLFGDFGINELGIYSDGLVVTSRARTDQLEAFMQDLLGWAASELGLKETGIPPREIHYESALIVELNHDFNTAFSKYEKAANMLTSFQAAYGLRPFIFDFDGIALAPDHTIYPGRKPAAFTLARRINTPHAANIYYSLAPLKTDDHLKLLDQMETLMGETR